MDKITFDEKIKTERLILKRHEVTFDYALLWYKVIQENKEFLTRFLEHFDNIISPEQEYDHFVDVDKKWQSGEKLCYAMWTKNGELVGSCDSPRIDYDRQEAEIGYFLCEKYTGHGYMTEAVKALEENLFMHGFNRLTIIMDAENTASEKVAIRCGFIKEGVMRQWRYNSKLQSWRNMNLYSKLKSEWEKEK